MPDTVDTVMWAPDGGRRYRPKYVEQFADINKLYIVASCWIIIDTCYAMHGPLNIKYTKSCGVRFVLIHTGYVSKSCINCYMEGSELCDFQL